MGPAKDMEHVTIGLIGLGTVGTGVARILTEHADRIARRAGKRVRWKWAVVRDPAKSRNVKLDGVRVTTDPARLIDDPEVEIVVEAMGGIDPALSIVLDCLAAGKHVVTANKALLAEHGPQIFAQARAAGRAVAFEASVGGGIPIIQALGVCAGRQPGPEPGRDPQRHVQLHPDQDDARGPGLATPARRRRSSGMPRPTRRSTWTAPTPRTSWRSSPSSPSRRPCETDRHPAARASTGCNWPTSGMPASSVTPSSCWRWPS